MTSMRLLPAADGRLARAVDPRLDRRRAWVLGASVLLHALVVAGFLTVARRREPETPPTPSYELVFQGADRRAAPTALDQADDATPKAVPQPSANPAPDSPAAAPPPEPTPTPPVTPPTTPAPPAPAPMAPLADQPPAPLPLAPVPDPTPAPQPMQAAPVPDPPAAQPPPPQASPVLVEPDAPTPTAPSVALPVAPEPAPLPPPAPSAAAAPAPPGPVAPPSVRIEPPPEPAQPAPLVREVPLPAPPPLPVPPPRPVAPPRPRPPPSAALGTFANPMDLNFSRAPTRLAAPRTTAAPGSVASRSIDLSLGAPRNGPNRQEAFFDARAAAVGADWMQGVKAFWLRHRYYPPQAAQNGEDGTVEVEMRINRQGRVESATVKTRSGSVFLDMAAISVWRDAQLPPLPAETQGDPITITISINYLLIRR